MSLSSTGSIFTLRSEIVDIAYDWYICVPVLAYTSSFYRFLPIAYRLFINVHSPSYVYSIICISLVFSVAAVALFVYFDVECKSKRDGKERRKSKQ